MITELLIIIENIIKLFVITKRGVGGQKSNLPEVTKFAHIFLRPSKRTAYYLFFVFYILILLLLCYFNIIVLLCYFINIISSSSLYHHYIIIVNQHFIIIVNNHYIIIGFDPPTAEEIPSKRAGGDSFNYTIYIYIYTIYIYIRA